MPNGPFFGLSRLGIPDLLSGPQQEENEKSEESE